jgi:hypothetical protein
MITSLLLSRKAGRPEAICALCILGLMGFVAAQAAEQPLPGDPVDSHVNQDAGFAATIRGTAGLADFDGDSRTDIAFAKPRGLANGVFHYQVEVLLSGRPRATFEVESGRAGGGLHIVARDVDGDQDLDLVITTEFSGEPVGVWINDGHGGFTPGDAAIYPASIWQEIQEAIEGQRSRLGLDLCCVLPGGGCSAGPDSLPLPPLGNPRISLQSTSDGHVSHPWNLGRPLRAPPIL